MQAKAPIAKPEIPKATVCEDPVFLEFSQKCASKKENNDFSIADLVICQE